MPLKELTAADIHEISELSCAIESIDRPEEYTLGDMDGPAWREWDVASERLISRIENLSDQARGELAALMWLGREDFSDFDSALKYAQRSAGAGDSRYLAAKIDLDTHVQAGARIAGFAI